MKSKYLIPMAAVLLLSAIFAFKASDGIANPPKLHTIKLSNAKELKDFFKYSADRLPFISAHRGGPRKGFPENCIATFENTLSHTAAILEIDPHYTKDGQIILMHDATLDRTSNGHGKISDYTLAELKKLRLKDTEGNLTDYQIPTLDEVLQWAKGKTIMILDEKDVPIEARAKKIIENNAQASAIVIAYSLDDAKKCYALSKDIVMEVMMGKIENADLLDKSGVAWTNVVGFVSHEVPKDKIISDAVHKRGAMCIFGSSRNYDKAYTSNKINAAALTAGYHNLVEKGADIIEADLGIEAGEAIREMQNAKSSKAKYFRN